MLGKPQGIFDLKDSNRAVGSYIKRSDACEIFQVREDAFRDLSWQEISGVWVIDERELHTAWYEHRIHGAAPPGGGKMGVDELVIECLLRRSFPRCIVTRQVRVQRFQMDLKVESGDKTLYIEFDGPHHFTVSGYGQPHDPRIKKKKVEDQTGIEVVNWPFWINRCESNVRSLFDRQVRGYGAIWSAGTSALSICTLLMSRPLAARMTGHTVFDDENGAVAILCPATSFSDMIPLPFTVKIASGCFE